MLPYKKSIKTYQKEWTILQKGFIVRRYITMISFNIEITLSSSISMVSCINTEYLIMKYPFFQNSSFNFRRLKL